LQYFRCCQYPGGRFGKALIAQGKTAGPKRRTFVFVNIRSFPPASVPFGWIPAETCRKRPLGNREKRAGAQTHSNPLN
jgi:hypothetical protein